MILTTFLAALGLPWEWQHRGLTYQGKVLGLPERRLSWVVGPAWLSLIVSRSIHVYEKVDLSLCRLWRRCCFGGVSISA